ncbi:aliphatic nitrilase-like protein [Corynespora cassiicola Philippines]|uniref:nitrilase n=1 Tax=Corynespora cassiicola Philippines TaxID=1448308 RepID=A0A2T2N891_CORCC|nr:aliphatic nitrilase-like protein [Corynespora cassiicola Philippines]
MLSIASLALFLGTVAAAPAAVPSKPAATPDYNNLTVAIVRAEPVNWPMPIMNTNWTGRQFDLNATVTKGIRLIEEAASNGANLVVFPELWFPGYPQGMADRSSMGPWLSNYIENSLTLNSSHWTALVKAATDNNVYLSPAFSHREDGNIYMAQALIHPDGSTFVRHKLRPSGGERTLFSDGTTDDLKVIATPYGRWGILECWEHFHPSMTFNVQAQVETLHIAAWPYTPDAGDPLAQPFETLESNLAAARVYAISANSPVVFASVGNVRFLDAQGVDLAVVEAAVSTVEQPLAYHSFNTTGLAETEPYAPNDEQAWGTLQQIVQSFPAYIPRVKGSFVAKKLNPIAEMLAGEGH